MVEYIRSDAPKAATLKHRENIGVEEYNDEWKKEHLRQYFLLNFKDLKAGSSSDLEFKPTGLISFDIDIYSEEEMIQARATLLEKLKDFIMVMFKSPSGGIKFIIQTDMLSTSNEAFKWVYKKIQSKIKSETGLRTEFDTKTCNINRGVIASWDPDCYFNPEAGAIDTAGMLDDFDEHLAQLKSMIPDTIGLQPAQVNPLMAVVKRLVFAMKEEKISQHTGKYLICCQVRKHGGNRGTSEHVLKLIGVQNKWFKFFDVEEYLSLVWLDIITDKKNDPSLMYCGFTEEKEKEIKTNELKAIFQVA